MPMTINGVGTMYYGNRNRSSSVGQCEWCGRQTRLSDYETTLFFTFLYIPIIPLGKKQILGECAACSRHRVASADDWARVRDEQVASAQHAATEAGDAASLMNLVQTSTAFKDQAAAAAAAQQLEAGHGADAGTRFFLGAWYEEQGKRAESHKHFREAMRLAPTVWHYRRAVAMCDLETGDLASAAAILKDAEPPSANFEPALFVMLAKAHQQRGQHDQAHRVLKSVLEATPSASSDKDFRETMRTSEKALGLMESAVPHDPIWRSSKFWGVTAALALLAAIFGGNYYISQHRKVYVVNGLGATITAVIDDQEVVVSPRGWTTIELPEGKHRASLQKPFEIAAEEFEVSASWFGRFFSKPAFVVDPSKSAMVIKEYATYVDKKNPLPPAVDERKPEVRIGQLYTQIDDANYVFAPFPEELDVGSKPSRVGADFDRQPPLTGSERATAIFSTEASPAEQLDFMERHLRTLTAAEMEDAKFVLAAFSGIATAIKQEARVNELLKSRLTEKPLLVDWHRTYQTLRENKGEVPALIKEYDELLKSAGDDAALLYLRGRIDPDPAIARSFYEKSQAANAKFPYAWYADGYRELRAGNFSGGLERIQKAAALRPNDFEFKHAWRDARFAARSFDDLKAELRSARSREPNDTATLIDLLEAYSASGNGADEADAEKLLLELKLPPRMSLLGIKQLDQRSSAAAAVRAEQAPLAEVTLRYFQGKLADVEKAIDKLPEDDRPQWRDILRAEQGPLESVTELQIGGNLEELCRYIDLATRGKTDSLPAALDKATQALGKEDSRHGQLAQILKQPQIVDADLDRILTHTTVQKSIVLVALAIRHPAQREKLLALAEKLNYRLAFPRGFVKQQIALVRKLGAK